MVHESEIVEQLRDPGSLIGPTLLLLLAESSGHGYGLAERLRELGFPRRPTGAVYRELGRLEEEGLVTSFWEASQIRGPARRVYELTESGRQTLRACGKAATELRRTLDDYVTRWEKVAGSSARSQARGASRRRPPTVPDRS